MSFLLLFSLGLTIFVCSACLKNRDKDCVKNSISSFNKVMTAYHMIDLYKNMCVIQNWDGSCERKLITVTPTNH